MKVLLVDDHPVVRQGLRLLLEARGGASAVGEAATAAEARARVESTLWDALVLDLDLPDRSGLDLLRELHADHPRLPVLILSVHPENMMAVRLLHAGAAGYLNKDSASEELVQAVQRVAAGGRYISRALAELLARQVGREFAEAPHERLSEREFQVFLALSAGRAVSEIAQRMNLSVNTVSTYRARLLEKMGLANNADLVRYAAARRLV